MQNSDMYTLLCYVQPLLAFHRYQKDNFKPFWSRHPGAKVSSEVWHPELIFHTKDPACCLHQALPPSTLLQTSKTSAAAVLDSEPECVGGEGRPLHSVSRCTMSKQGRLFYCASVPLSCLELKAAVQVRNLQGSMLTMFKLSPDLAQCCSREQANNQALAAYREACQGLPAVAWGCKCDFGWPCTNRKEFARCIRLLTLSSP